jgi:hypothetical protein
VRFVSDGKRYGTELEDLTVEEVVSIYTDPVVNATLQTHSHWQLQHQLHTESERADKAEQEIQQLQVERCFWDDDMINRTTH